jgi:hypothetical protein
MIRAFLALCLLAASFGCQPVYAQSSPCAPWDQVVATLWENYGEAVAAEMTDRNGWALHLFAAPNTGTWTLMQTSPGGPTCIRSSGQNFDAQSEVPAPSQTAPEGDDL